jgi:hypothetical protein
MTTTALAILDRNGNVISYLDGNGNQTSKPVPSTAAPRPKNGEAGLMPGMTCAMHQMISGREAYNTGAGAPDWQNDCGQYRGPLLPPPVGFQQAPGGNCAEGQLSFCQVGLVPYQWIPIFQPISPLSTGLVDNVTITVAPASNGLRLRTGATAFGFIRAMEFEDSDPEISIGRFRAPDITQSYNSWDAGIAIVQSPENAVRPASEWTWNRIWKGQNFAPAWVASYNIGTVVSSRFVDIACANSDALVNRFVRGQVLVDYRPPRLWPALTPENYSKDAGTMNPGYRIVQVAV